MYVYILYIYIYISKSAAELRPRHRAKNESDETPLNFHVEYLVLHLFSSVALILIMYCFLEKLRSCMRQGVTLKLALIGCAFLWPETYTGGINFRINLSWCAKEAYLSIMLQLER